MPDHRGRSAQEYKMCVVGANFRRRVIHNRFAFVSCHFLNVVYLFESLSIGPYICLISQCSQSAIDGMPVGVM